MKKSLKLIIYIFLFLLVSVPVYASQIDNENIISQSYNLIYDANGGKNAPQNELISANTNVAIISEKIPEKSGYTFLGWTLKGDSTIYKSGEEIIIDKDTTLYASWKVNRYGIKYYGNGSTSGSTLTQTKLKCGITYNLSENGFKKIGYTFVGWNTKADGTGVSLSDEQAIRNLSTKDGKIVKLYAQWKKTAYEITYNLKKGTQNSKNPSKYYYTSDRIILKEPTRKGYTFTGWYLVSSPKTKVTVIEEGSTGDLELFASWVANRYNIKYYGNGSTSGSTETQTKLKYGIEYNLSINGFKRTGYTFVGWNTKADGTGISLMDEETIKNLSTKNGKTVKLYAQWKANKYTVNFIYDGDEQMSSVTYKYDKNYLLPANIYTREGYEFAGWNTKINGKGVTYSNKQKVKNLTSKNKGQVNLYPMWKPEQPTIINITNTSYESIEMDLDIGDTAQGYIVYRANSYNGKYAKVGTITTNSTTFQDRNLTSRKTYYYKIRSFEVNEYGIRMYSDYSDVYIHTTAEKPSFAAIITNYSDYSWYFVDIDIKNYGTKDMEFLEVANFYPYEGAPYTASEIYGDNVVYAGRQCEISYYLGAARYFYDDSFIFTAFRYDGCIYYVKIPKTGKAIYSY